MLELADRLNVANDPDLRTAMRADEKRIAAFLVSIFSSETEEQTTLRLEGDSAQHFLDVVQEILDRGFLIKQEDIRMVSRLIRKLSELCDRLPSSLFIAGVNDHDEHACFAGGFGEIYRASYGEQRVALKRMRHFSSGSDLRRIHLKFCREALLWKDLHHPNILPFLGIDRDSFLSSLCMVSLWMDHGTVMNYLKSHGHANVDKLLYEIAQGLEYLHFHNIVHGDLRGANILIQEDWSACLADFGLSTFSDATATMSTTRAGSLGWMAPELLAPERFGLDFARTPATDVYAFGCVCVELYTGRPPFSRLPQTTVLLKVLDSERPERPFGPPAMSDTLWKHVTNCWTASPTTRPSIQLVVWNMARSSPVPRSLAPSGPLVAAENHLPDSTPPATSEPSGVPTVQGPTISMHESSMPSLTDADASLPLLDLVNLGIGTEIPPVLPDTQPKEVEAPMNAAAGGEDRNHHKSIGHSLSARDKVNNASTLMNQGFIKGGNESGEGKHAVTPRPNIGQVFSRDAKRNERGTTTFRGGAGGHAARSAPPAPGMLHIDFPDFLDSQDGFGGKNQPGAHGAPTNLLGIEGQTPCVPNISVLDFCLQYRVSDKIRQLLDEEGFETAGSLLEMSDMSLKEAGFRVGQIAELKRALKELVTNTSAKQ
ncbi:kinase-like domain-containing protein [Mycena galopus ATCC 62051]|nr:kinase-like domain-containing protein [Mycena galopus ATCC 62051]